MQRTSTSGKSVRYKRISVFVASPTNGCPKVITAGSRLEFRDDYSGSVRAGKGLSRMLF